MKNNYEKAIDRLDPTAPDYWKRRMVLQVKSFKYENSRTKINEYDMKKICFLLLRKQLKITLKQTNVFLISLLKLKT